MVSLVKPEDFLRPGGADGACTNSGNVWFDRSAGEFVARADRDKREGGVTKGA